MVCRWPLFFLNRYLCVRTCMWCMLCRAFLLFSFPLHIWSSFRIIAASWSVRHGCPHRPVGLVFSSPVSVPLLPQCFPFDGKLQTLVRFVLLCCSSPQLRKNLNCTPDEVRPSDVSPVAFRSPHGTGETTECPNAVCSVSRCPAQNSTEHSRGWGWVNYLARCRLNTAALASAPDYVASLFRRR